MKKKETLEEISILDRFEVEELEKRYEFGWRASTVEAETPYGPIIVWEV